MEMASGCPRPAANRDAQTTGMPRRPVRGPHGGWQPREIDALRARIAQAESSGESLRSVFEEMGEQLGRKPNSIRNFYYAQLRAQEGETASRALPFETFTPQEIESLIASVLTARAQGLSVRACVRRLSGGDRAKMLRYQNKYRSVVRTRPELVRAVMERLAEEGTPYVSPYPEDNAPRQLPAAGMPRAKEYADPQIAQLFSSLDYLLELACAHQSAEPDEPALRRADRLRAQCDVLRIELSDERRRAGQLRAEAGGMVTMLKEFIALPQDERENRCASFCAAAAQRLSAVECALDVGDDVSL